MPAILICLLLISSTLHGGEDDRLSQTSAFFDEHYNLAETYYRDRKQSQAISIWQTLADDTRLTSLQREVSVARILHVRFDPIAQPSNFLTRTRQDIDAFFPQTDAYGESFVRQLLSRWNHEDPHSIPDFQNRILAINLLYQLGINSFLELELLVDNLEAARRSHTGETNQDLLTQVGMLIRLGGYFLRLGLQADADWLLRHLIDRRLVSKRSDKIKALHFLVYVLEQMRELDDAVLYAESLLELTPDNEAVFAMLARLYFFLSVRDYDDRSFALTLHYVQRSGNNELGNLYRAFARINFSRPVSHLHHGAPLEDIVAHVYHLERQGHYKRALQIYRSIRATTPFWAQYLQDAIERVQGRLERLPLNASLSASLAPVATAAPALTQGVNVAASRHFGSSN